MRYITLVVMLISLVGCSNNNKVIINNIAAGTVLVNFRAKIYEAAPGQTTEIKDIPNGTFDYSTTYAIPSAELKGEISGDAASGELIFEDKETKVNFIFSSVISDSTYTLSCTKSSTRSLSSSTLTSAEEK